MLEVHGWRREGDLLIFELKGSYNGRRRVGSAMPATRPL